MGLRENSRIKIKLRNEPCERDSLLLAVLIDRVSMIFNLFSDKKIETSITDLLLDIETERESDYQTFESRDDFRAKWLEIIGGN